ncbi:MAG: small subunit ribosomal protein [Pyrinomonadaceae bacterium]|nr:small subunit ribosomal protein [Pyrinomonadaceae bacterium]
MAVTVTMKELLEAGVHFGHQVRRWNPKMKEYIFGERNGINIIDLQKTQKMFREAIGFVTNMASEDRGRTILFVGTKRQAQDAIREEASRANQYYINQRWLGGLLTNFQTVQKSIKRLRDLEAMQTDGRYEMLTKKERIKLDRERETLEKNLSGIKNMTRLPDALFIIDVRKEEIAVAEANRLGIPVIAVVDTNCSPEGIDYIIPGNDDALRAVRLFASRIADAVVEGQEMRSKAADDDGAEVDAGAGATGGSSATSDTGTRNSLSASGDGTSSITTARDPGLEAKNFTDMGASAPSTETQVSVAGNIGFGKTGQQPDSVGDHPAEGTGAPVRGATGGGSDESEVRGQSSAEQEKGAESVGAAK